jgi:hypothetical protein
MSDEPNFTPEPNAVWVVCDLPIDIEIQEGKVPKNDEELYEFAEAFNEYAISKGATYAKFILFGKEGVPSIELEYEFPKNNS